MSKKQMTLVYYYVPEDQDDPEYPNVFGVMVGKDNIRLNHIIDNFPLNGTYIFRFKALFDGTAVWLDFNDLNRSVPMIKNRIYVKATRISWESQNSLTYLKERKQAYVPQTFNKSMLNQTKSQKNLPKQVKIEKKEKTQKNISQSLLDVKHPKTNQVTHDLLSHNHTQNNSQNNVSNLLETHTNDMTFNNHNFSHQLLNQPTSINITNVKTATNSNIFDHLQNLNVEIGLKSNSSQEFSFTNSMSSNINKGNYSNQQKHHGGDSLL